MARTGWALGTASSWRARGWPRLLPINVTVSTNFRCNFKCATCNVYERKVKELEADEWAKVFRSLGRAPAWMTFSGGEPFLRRDLPDIILSAVESCRPAVLTIPTNGWFTDRVVNGSERICREAPDTQLKINLSIDHNDPHRHDEIRGAKGSWDRLMVTLERLRALNLPNLTIGVHTVISRENDQDFPGVAQGLAKLGADSYIAECAEERVELQTMESGIGPKADRFRRAAAAVLAVDAEASGGVARGVRALRGEYYSRVARLLDGDETAMPVCHAGFLSTHLTAEGEVWSCCVLARSFGNLRDTDFDFRPVWFSGEAEKFRQWMRERRCACPLANATYTNLLAEPVAVGRVALGLTKKRTLAPSNGESSAPTLASSVHGVSRS
ncbi:MAG: radical SAM protein [Actinomycetota bacterium]|nr:radical SAM protein [Actinomycetota bacterium]